MEVTVLKLVIFHISVKNVRANAPAAHTNVTILLDVLVCYIYTRINSFKTVFSKSMTGCIFCHFRKINPSKSILVSYDVTQNHMESTSSRSEGYSFFKTLPNAIIYSVVIFVIAFVVFFGLFSGTYFYKHCINQHSTSDGKHLDAICNQQERYNNLLQSSNIVRQNNGNSVYLEPISSVLYEEIERYAETDN